MKRFFAILSLLLALNCAAAVYYVNNAVGDDANDGLAAHQPFRTLRQAMSVLGPGDTLVLAPGKVYYESLEFQRGGTPEAPVTIEGNGAVISGRETVPADNWRQFDGGLWLNANKVQSGALRPLLFNEAGEMISRDFQTSPEKLQPGEAVWNGDGIYYRPNEGKFPAEMTFYGCYKSSGVVLNGQSYVTVNRIVTENFANDGVNVHGSCHGLIFRNLVSRWNGDDGFSIHEDAQAVVLGAHLHHNDYGIQDIGLSRSFFFGVLSEDNRLIGGDFHGGLRSIEDSLFRNNGLRQLQFSSNSGAAMGVKNGNPMENARGYLRNVLVCGGRGAAIRVCNQADVTALNCTFLDTEQGFIVKEGAALHLVLCAFANTGNNVVENGGTLTAVASAFSPAAATWGDKKFEGQDFLAALGDDSNAAAMAQVDDHFRAKAPVLTFQGKLKAPGFDSAADLPFIPQPPTQLLASVTNAKHHFDFEETNPWSRVYWDGVPAGLTPQGDSTLSAEQAASGSKSAKISLELPAASKPYNCLLKLFTQHIQTCTAPLKRLSCQIHGAKQGNKFRLRVRDRDGECFYGPLETLDWDGWKSVSWDLVAVPPNNIVGGNGNRQQDCPPLEIVLEIFFQVPAEGLKFECFLDDLSFE